MLRPDITEWLLRHKEVACTSTVRVLVEGAARWQGAAAGCQLQRIDTYINTTHEFHFAVILPIVLLRFNQLGSRPPVYPPA
jgi:hypothetical protein